DREFKPGMDLQQLQRQLSDPNTPQEIKDLIRRKLQEQLDQQLKGMKHGSIVIESPDVYASWKAGDGGSAGAPAPAGGSPAPAPAAGGGSAAPAPTPAPAPQAAPAPLVPSNDVLPAFQGLVKPKVRKESDQKRQERLPGLDADGVKALFDELGQNDLGSRVYEADGNYSLIQVVDKATAKIDDFDKDAARLIDEIRERRGDQLIHDWLKARCEELTTAGKIKPRGDKVAEFDDKGKPAPTVYRPCMTLR